VGVTVQTQRIVFGSSIGCAFPGCEVPAVTWNLDAPTLSCQCAHIRSAKKRGPRHDPNYTDPDGAHNLFLLCGTHHPMVDTHAAVYSVDELTRWRERSLVSKTPDRYTTVELESLRAITRASTRLIAGKKRSEMSSDLSTISAELAILAQLRTQGLRTAAAVERAASNAFARPGAGTTPQVLESAVAALWAELSDR